MGIRTKSLLLLSPVLLAYVLHGAKTSLTFLPIFVLTGAIFFMAFRHWSPRPVPVSILLPFVLFLFWCWMPLLGGAPLDLHLYYYSRAFFYVMAGFLVYQYADEDVLNDFEWVVMGLGGIEALLIIIAPYQRHDPQLSGFLKNSLHSGLLLPAAFGVSLSKVKDNKWPRFHEWTLLIFGLLMVWAVLLIRSRGGILVIGSLVLYLFPKKSLWIIAAAALAVGVMILIKGQNHFFHYLEIDAVGSRSTLGRFGIWLTALDAIRFKPFLGFGLGNFETAYLQFQHPSDEYLRYGKLTMFTHNGFLQVAVEAGLPGLCLLGWGYFVSIGKALPLLFKERSLFSILIVFFVTSLFNYSLALPLNGFVFAATVSFLASKILFKQKAVFLAERPLIPAFMFILLSFFLACYAGSQILQAQGNVEMAVRLCPLRSDAWYQLGLKKLQEKKEALPFFHRALIWNNRNSFIWQRMALVLTNFKPMEETSIDAYFRRAQTLAPFQAPFYTQEGFYRFKKRQLNEARELFAKAISLEPAAPVPHFGLALVLLQQQKRQAADAELQLASSLKHRQRELEKDPIYWMFYREIFATDYGHFLFQVDEKDLNKPL